MYVSIACFRLLLACGTRWWIVCDRSAYCSGVGEGAIVLTLAING